MKKQLIGAVTMILIIVLLLTGCGTATQNSIAITTKVNVRTEPFTIPVPESSGIYEYTEAFPNVNPDELAKLFFADSAVTRTESSGGIYYRTDDPAQGRLRFTFSVADRTHFSDGKWNLPANQALNINFNRDVDWRTASFYVKDPFVNFRNYGFSAEHGNIGTVLAESGDGDPKMEAALIQSGAIMEHMNYDSFKLVIANKYSKESVKEICRMMGAYGEGGVLGYDEATGQVKPDLSGIDVVPDTEWYYIQYNVIPDTLPKDIDTDAESYFLKVTFLFDKDGLVSTTLYPQPTFTPVKTGAPCTAEEAFEISKQGEEWQNVTLFSMHYTLKEISDTRYIGIWELHYTVDITETLDQTELERIQKIGASGKLQRMSIYVDALHGIKLDATYDRRSWLDQFPVLISKYNMPELFTQTS